MKRNTNGIFEKLTALAKHGGYIIISVDDYSVQCFAEKGKTQLDVEVIPDYHLSSPPESEAGEFTRLRFKRDGDLTESNYYKTYNSSFVNHNIQTLISDVQEIFDNIYEISDEKDFEIIDYIDYPEVIKQKEENERRLRRSSRNSFLWAGLFVLFIAGGVYYYIYYASGSPNNQQAVSMDELEALQSEDAELLEEYAPARDVLNPKELIDLAGCASVECVQLYMKDKTRDFIYAKKGEYAAKRRTAVPDTSGHELIIPVSTYYVEIYPQTSWKAVHTIHSKTLSDSLLKEFEHIGFQFAGKRYYADVQAEGYRYVSEKYPGISLYVTATFNPWGLRGLYVNKVNWPCYMFEVYRD